MNDKEKLFIELFLNDTPLLDVRAPIEFDQGAFPCACNMPILDDDQRMQIGLCYKQKGKQKATELGYSLISGKLKQDRIRQWSNYCKINPHAMLYCFRGGMRSHIVQQWLEEADIQIPLISGGYKEMRQFLIHQFEQPLNLIRISGQTGVGKTDFLNKFDHKIDLEEIANHRGSAFGGYAEEQPSQINFENQLAIQIIKLKHSNDSALLIEDEGRYIGSNNLPQGLIRNMNDAEILLLTCPLDQRIERIYQQYVVTQLEQYSLYYKNSAKQQFAAYLEGGLGKIQKRLGGVKYSNLLKIMQDALNSQSESLHKTWIRELLENYYDPMYDYQLNKKSDKIIFTGNKSELFSYINRNQFTHPLLEK